MRNGRGLRGFGIYIFLLIIIVFVWFALEATNRNSNKTQFTQAAFEQALEDDEVYMIVIEQNQQVPTGTLEIELTDGTSAELVVPDVNAEQDYLEEVGFTNYEFEDVRGDNIWLSLLPSIILIVAIILMFVMMTGQAGGGSSNQRMMNFGKSRATMTSGENVKVGFRDVAGLSEEKEELEGLVDFLKEPFKYTRLGARIPTGVLLVGPPGTGKTLIAKAVAGEAGVPFFSISGSDFVEMFVGVGASRVRDMFAEAKKNSPCIVFIDEIDAVGRRRGTGLGGGHDEREQTLNQLLVEMDGFGVNEGIIVLAATNRVDILDPALMRPGRFDRKVYVGRPDVRGREQILEVHARNKPLSDDVDLKQIAQTTAGFTGADLENLLNEAAILAAKDKRLYIDQEDIRRSFIKVGIGAEKKSRIITQKEKRITAYHESGHAILFHLLPDVGPVYTVSIIPTGVGAAGYTMPLPEKDEMFMTKGQMLQEIMVSLGGRIAEELIFEDVTTGAAQDIKQATSIAKSMVTQYGMSDEIGLLNYGEDDDEVFIGRDLAHTKGYSDNVATLIDAEIKRIVDECYVKAKEIILAHEDVLNQSAELLLEKEKIGRIEFEALFGGESGSPYKDEEVLEEDNAIAFVKSDNSDEFEDEDIVVEEIEKYQEEQAKQEDMFEDESDGNFEERTGQEEVGEESKEKESE
ncbi:MAG: ATP-dependent zinc metalloprotease FtsH [Lachnospiraceae bacterium]|nr:ATP-dependent zinc metalloprotease FtsH [Lachnospiraceae bacterium]